MPADILNLQQRRNAKVQPRQRCTRCDGRRQVWEVKVGNFIPCPECTHPEPTARAA